MKTLNLILALGLGLSGSSAFAYGSRSLTLECRSKHALIEVAFEMAEADGVMITSVKFQGVEVKSATLSNEKLDFTNGHQGFTRLAFLSRNKIVGLILPKDAVEVALTPSPAIIAIDGKTEAALCK